MRDPAGRREAATVAAWKALRERCCSGPEQAKRVVMVARADLDQAVAAAIAACEAWDREQRPAKRTAQDIQAEIGMLQAELHLLVLGDPRERVDCGPDPALRWHGWPESQSPGAGYDDVDTASATWRLR